MYGRHGHIGGNSSWIMASKKVGLRSNFQRTDLFYIKNLLLIGSDSKELTLPCRLLNVFKPKSEIFNTQRLSMTQFDDFKLPCDLISVEWRYSIP